MSRGEQFSSVYAKVPGEGECRREVEVEVGEREGVHMVVMTMMNIRFLVQRDNWRIW